MMQQAQKMQTKMQEMQDNLEKEEYEGQAGGGMVKVTVSGKGDMKKVGIDKSLMDPEETEMLEDLIIAAFSDAKKKSEDASAEKMGELTGGLGLPPGMKLPF